MSGKSLEFLRKMFLRRVNSGGFDQHLSEVKLISGGEGKCEAVLEVQKAHLNMAGSLHGGFTSTLVDSISTLALMTDGDGEPGVSVDMKISYLSAAKLREKILIRAETVKRGRRLSFLSVRITSEATDRLIATGEHIKFMSDKKHGVASP